MNHQWLRRVDNACHVILCRQSEGESWQGQHAGTNPDKPTTLALYGRFLATYRYPLRYRVLRNVAKARLFRDVSIDKDIVIATQTLELFDGANNSRPRPTIALPIESLLHSGTHTTPDKRLASSTSSQFKKHTLLLLSSLPFSSLYCFIHLQSTNCVR